MCCFEMRVEMDTLVSLGIGSYLMRPRTVARSRHGRRLHALCRADCDSGRRVGCLIIRPSIPLLCPRSPAVSRDIHIPFSPNPLAPGSLYQAVWLHTATLPVPRCRAYTLASPYSTFSFSCFQHSINGQMGSSAGVPQPQCTCKCRGMVRPGTSASAEVTTLMAAGVLGLA